MDAAIKDKIILVMDGDCALCSWGARTIARHDRHDVFRIATVQSQSGAEMLQRHGLDPDDPWSWLMIVDGQALTGSDAVVRAGRHLAAPWGPMARIGQIVPRFIREPVYRFVARNRIAWFGREDLCALPDPALRARLLD